VHNEAVAADHVVDAYWRHFELANGDRADRLASAGSARVVCSEGGPSRVARFVDVDEIVGVVVEIDGSVHHWLTWGRVFGGVEYDELAAALVPHLSRHGVTPRVEDVEFESLRLASAAPFFYECLVGLMDQRMLALLDDRTLRDTDRWLETRRAILTEKSESAVWYCGESGPAATD
jgi:hypothetical protein